MCFFVYPCSYGWLQSTEIYDKHYYLIYTLRGGRDADLQSREAVHRGDIPVPVRTVGEKSPLEAHV